MLKEFFKRVSGMARLEAIIEQQQIIIRKQDEAYTQVFQNCMEFQNLRRDVKSKDKLLKEAQEEVRLVEKTYEATIDQQYSELQKLRTQLANRTDLEGKFYVFNPLADKPRKIYDTYAAALEDAKKVSKVCGGQRILVLKIVSGVEINEKFIDFSLEEEVPF